MSEKKYRDEDWLREKYYEEGLTLSEMGSICGVTDACISDNMEKSGIERRGKSQAQKNREDERIYNKDWLEKQYLENKRSMYEIAEMTGVEASTILRSLRKNNIETRRKGMPKPKNIDKLSDEKWLENNYIGKEKSLSTIGSELEVCADTVKKYLERNNIQTREKKIPEYVIERNKTPHNQKYPYASIMWKEKRKEIIKRDGKCLLCEKKTGLSVHHITPVDYYKNEDKEGYNVKEANRNSNLATLCKTCHGKITVRNLFYERGYQVEEFIEACKESEVDFNE
jgi:5-methylcytosine-specific restriction endonuclease McrA/predicted DNA-binding protein YlxM (UPF0122 family)